MALLSSVVPPTAPCPQAILERQLVRESSARTYARSLPIVPVRASGTTVEGADGRRYLDCLSGAGALALGHNHPAVIAAIRGMLDRGAPLQVLDVATPERDAFVEELFSTLPEPLARRGRVHFCGPAGTDAVEAAWKLAQTATGRSGLLAFSGGYHGHSAGALAATGNVAIKEGLRGVTAEVSRLPYPHRYRCPFGLGDDPDGVVAARYVERLLADPSGGIVPPAAMIVEPVQGEGGIVPAPDPWLRAMRSVTEARGIVLVADEVQTGFCRTGRLFAMEHFGVEPDLMTLAKSIAGGLPLSAVLGKARVMDAPPDSAIGGTYVGNPVAQAAALAVLDVFEEERLLARGRDLGETMRARMLEWQERFPRIGDVRGLGPMLALELVRDPVSREPAPDVAKAVIDAALARGLILLKAGTHGNCIRVLCPLTIEDAVLDEALGVWEEALEVTLAG